MADMMETLKELLGDNADEKINTVLGMLGSQNGVEGHGSGQSGGERHGSGQNGGEGTLGGDLTALLGGGLPENSGGGITPELFSQAQGLMKQLSSLGGDDRSKLLMSLKPFMRESRRHSIDNAIKLLRLARLSHMFKGVF